MKKVLVLLVVMSFIGSCSHVISKASRELVDESVSDKALFANPDAYVGRTVLLGGFIVKPTHTNEGTVIEVVQNPLDYRGRPVNRDRSYGRFMILAEDFIDTSIFSPGRIVSMAGEVLGTKTQPLGEMDYPYLLVRSRELRIIPHQKRFPVHIGIGIHKSL
jgi:outer membrane lipoprotein